MTRARTIERVGIVHIACRNLLKYSEFNMFIRGQPIEEIYEDGYLLWRIEVRNPFFQNGQYWYGLSDKLIEYVRNAKVHRLLIKVYKNKNLMLPVPTKKQIDEKEKLNEYQIMPTKFRGLPDWKIYYFKL